MVLLDARTCRELLFV